MKNKTVSYAYITNVKIAEVTDYQVRRCLDSLGYTLRCGAPTNYMVQIDNSKIWYRVKCYQISNSGTLFIKTKNDSFLVVNQYDLLDFGEK
jgi:hypothetical protein